MLCIRDGKFRYPKGMRNFRERLPSWPCIASVNFSLAETDRGSLTPFDCRIPAFRPIKKHQVPSRGKKSERSGLLPYSESGHLQGHKTHLYQDPRAKIEYLQH